jgi:hypothetical protein
LETETLAPSLEDVPDTNLVFIEESEIQRDEDTALAPNFTPTECSMEKYVPNRLTDTDPDAGELHAEDDTIGTR